MTRDNNLKRQAWQLDQRAKSAFFQRKGQAWRLVATAQQLDQIDTETLNWDDLGVTADAWAIVAHQGIKPIIVFAHPVVLRQIHGSVAYYRMLAMVSQKSMKNIGFSLDAYETGRPLADEPLALAVAKQLNGLLSALVEAQPTLTTRDLDTWRGMSAGTQAQGSWQNEKGAIAETAIREMILAHLRSVGVAVTSDTLKSIPLLDGRTMIFADEPDIAITRAGVIDVAMEVKGGIDPAAILERWCCPQEPSARPSGEPPCHDHSHHAGNVVHQPCSGRSQYQPGRGDRPLWSHCAHER